MMQPAPHRTQREPESPGRSGSLSALLLVCSVGAGMTACSINADNPAGYGYTGRGPSVVSSDTLTVTGEDTTWTPDFPLEDAELLFVGAYLDFHSSALLRFTDLPAGATVVEARLSLTRRSKSVTADSLISLKVTASPVTSDWDTTWTGADSGALGLGTPIGTAAIAYAAAGDTFGFDLPDALVQSWVDDPVAAARGIALTAPDTDPYVIYLDSADSPSIRSINRPRLRLRYIPAGGGSSRLLTLNPSHDTSLMTFTATPPAGELWLSRGVPWRSMLTFPDPGVPAGATVNRAVLHVPLAGSGSISTPLSLFAAAPAGPSPWTLPYDQQFASGTTSAGVSIAGADTTAAFVVTRALADRVAMGGTIRLMLATTGEGGGIALVRLLDATAPAARRARLELWYSEPPSGTP